MKNLILIIAIIITQIPAIYAVVNDSSDCRNIGFNLNYFYSESGYGPGLNLNVSIERDKRRLGMGLIMQQENVRLSGGEIHYKHFISSIFNEGDSGVEQYRNLRFFVNYNFIFRKNILPDSYSGMSSAMEQNVIPGGRVATFEHYIGGGAQVRLIDQIYLNAGVGYGIILGSIKEIYQDEPHFTEGGRKNDFGLSAKFGLSYSFIR